MFRPRSEGADTLSSPATYNLKWRAVRINMSTHNACLTRFIAALAMAVRISYQGC